MTPVKITDDLFVPMNHRLTSENPPHPSAYISLTSQLQTTLLPFASRFCFIFSFFGENLWSTIRGELFESVFHFFTHIFKNNWRNWQFEVCKLFLMVEKSTLQSVTSFRAHGYHPVLFPPLTCSAYCFCVSLTFVLSSWKAFMLWCDQMIFSSTLLSPASAHAVVSKSPFFSASSITALTSLISTSCVFFLTSTSPKLKSDP